MTLLDVKNLEVSFKMRAKKLHAVRGVSFQIAPGETVGIVGESGCGKSSVAKALIKLLPPYSSEIAGEIWYGGENILPYSEKQMRRVRGREIAMIFQDPMTSLNPTLKIGTQIVEGYLRHHPEVSQSRAYEYAIEMLELVGIPQPDRRVNEYPHTLSGGTRQRVMIALALASKPKLLLADEPTTALDVTIQAQILDLMKKIQEKTHTSILLITHDLSVVAQFCDRVLVMYAGKIVESAPVEELFENPKHPYTQRLLQAIPRLDKDPSHPLIPIEGSPPDLSLPIQGCGFCVRCPSQKKICRAEEPPLFKVAAEHYNACWMQGECHE